MYTEHTKDVTHVCAQEKCRKVFKHILTEISKQNQLDIFVAPKNQLQKQCHPMVVSLLFLFCGKTNMYGKNKQINKQNKTAYVFHCVMALDGNIKVS